MKQIGHIDGANAMPSTWKTHSLGMLSPHDLFIPNPGERENVSADQWNHVGWVNPDKDGGCVWDTHAEAGANSRPAYIQREHAEPTDKPWKGVPDDPMDVRRSEFDALTKRFDLLAESTGERIWALEKIRYQRAAKIGMSKTYGETSMLTRSIDTEPSNLSVHAFQISTDDLIKEALEFCRTELDAFDGIEYDSDSEVGCQRANVYIRELIGRLHGARQPKPAPTVQAEPPMSFYDYAFIASFIDLRLAGYDDVTRMQRAHAVAAKLTRNRAVPV